MAKSLKNKILKQFDTAYEGFPPDRSLHLAQSVFATIAETAEAEVQVDVSTLTIADICREVAELGPVNASIHKLDEHVEIAAIDPLKDIYRGTLERLLVRPA